MGESIKKYEAVQVGQKIYNNSRHSCGGYGIIYEIIGEQNPDHVQGNGFIYNITGQARFKIVYETYFTEYHESTLRDSSIEILDTVVGQREIDKAFVIAKKTIAEKEEKKRLKNEAIANAVAKNIKANPHLKTREDFPNISSHVLAAKNIRIELKKAFPGQKFSVTSDSFSMGNAVRVSRIDGPLTKDIDLIINKYQYGYFNGMEDIYEHNNDSVWPSDFGDTKYVSSSREYSEESKAKANEEIKKYDSKHFSCYELDQKKWQWLSEQDFYTKTTPVKPPTDTQPPTDTKSSETEIESAKNESTEGVQVVENEKFNGIEIYFPGKPDTETRDILKSAGFRWHRKKGCWYVKKSNKTIQTAHQVAGIKEEIKTELKTEPETPTTDSQQAEEQPQQVEETTPAIQAKPTVKPHLTIVPEPDRNQDREPVKPLETKPMEAERVQTEFIPALVDDLPDDIKAVN